MRKQIDPSTDALFPGILRRGPGHLRHMRERQYREQRQSGSQNMLVAAVDDKAAISDLFGKSVDVGHQQWPGRPAGFERYLAERFVT